MAAKKEAGSNDRLTITHMHKHEEGGQHEWSVSTQGVYTSIYVVAGLLHTVSDSMMALLLQSHFYGV